MAAKVVRKVVPVDQMRVDLGTQSRAETPTAKVKEYAQSYLDKAPMPPVDLFDTQEGLVMGDGHIRRAAAKLAGLHELEANIHTGTIHDARFFSAGANTAHGLPRTENDSFHAVKMILEDSVGKGMSDDWIKEKAHVSIETVLKVREAMGKKAEEGERRTGRDGKQYPAKKKRAAKEREPGDDSKAKTEPAKKKQGAQKYDWTNFNRNLSVVARAPDAIGAAYKGEKDGTEYAACCRCLETLAKVFKGWERRLAKL